MFEAKQCVVCHTVEGLSQRTDLGPDLTHLADGSTLAAGVLEHTPENLASWILDPQALKPGSRMPPVNLEPGDLEALLAYLATLQ